MKLKNKAGAELPYAYLRYKVAQHWGVPPWVVDEAPANEVAELTAILAIDGTMAAWPT